ncbi:FadR/GntR family transcriptional regulator [Spongiimicrobium sp. 3-5]|uniref:FadR/GntR family transcriptional regulator n=1 Tax=Spongiimicrobium sp. 3-5 TaxID=3332596 RepID=UPI00397EE60C
MSKKNGYGFNPISVPSVPERVEEELKKFFKKADLKPGDSIPKEMELAEYLGVSRSAIREALSRFRMLGLIESRKKRGMILTSPNILNGLERVLYPSFLDKKTILEIFEMRMVIELGLADFLFLRKTQEDLDDLQKILDSHKNKSDLTWRLDLEVKFHSKLYDITQNQSLKGFQKLLLPIFDFVIKNEAKLDNPPKKTTVSHQDLLNILRDGKPLEFKVAMEEHLRPHFEALVFYKQRNTELEN